MTQTPMACQKGHNLDVHLHFHPMEAWVHAMEALLYAMEAWVHAIVPSCSIIPNLNPNPNPNPKPNPLP